MTEPPRTEPEWLTEELAETVRFAVRGERRIQAGRSPHQILEAWDAGPPFGTLYRLDHAFMAASGDEFIYHENLVLPAAVTHGSPRRALILGGGDGGSARRLLDIPGLERVVLVELDPAVVEMARRHLSPIHRGSLDDPRVHLRIQDGVDYLTGGAEGGPFDLILFDLTDPGGQAAALYQGPCLHLCRQALADGGLLTLHTGSPFFHPDRLRQLIVALRQVFPMVRPFFFPAPLYGGWWGMACASAGPDPAFLSRESVESRLTTWDLTDLRYYNGAVHGAQFALPNFLRALLA